MSLVRKLRDEAPPPPTVEWRIGILGFGEITVTSDRSLRIKPTTDLPADTDVSWVLDTVEADELETALREAREQQEREQA